MRLYQLSKHKTQSIGIDEHVNERTNRGMKAEAELCCTWPLTGEIIDSSGHLVNRRPSEEVPYYWSIQYPC
jgi:hypothetical protein